jgi:broad specificity phosphatase PhoE
MRLLLIRHAQSTGNAEGRVQGQADMPLTELGRRQERALAHRFQHEAWNPSTIYSSDLVRAAETAEILAGSQGLAVVGDERLREYDCGVLTNLTGQDIEALYPEIWYSMHHSTEWVSIAGEEGNAAFDRRLAEVLAEIKARHGGEETVAIVSHGASLGTLLCQMLGLDTGRPAPFHFGNTSISIVELRPPGPVLTLLNDTCHLDGESQWSGRL